MQLVCALVALNPDFQLEQQQVRQRYNCCCSALMENMGLWTEVMIDQGISKKIQTKKKEPDGFLQSLLLCSS